MSGWGHGFREYGADWMAGDWIKMRTCLAAERAVMLLCDKTGLDTFAVVGRLHAVWSWAGDHADRHGVVRGISLTTVDRVAAHSGFASAMLTANWLEEVSGNGIRFPRWQKHNSKSARERALGAERAAKSRWKKSRSARDGERDATVTNHDAREEKTREEKNHRHKGDGKAKGSSHACARGEPAPSPDPSPPSSPSLPSPKESCVGEEQASQEANGEAFEQAAPYDLSLVDWGQVEALAEAIARKIPVMNTTDRRMWLKAAVLAQVRFSEDWLMDAVEAVAHAKETKTTKQAHFMGVLQSKAAEAGIDRTNFVGMMGSIKIPGYIWKSSVLELRR